MTLNEILHDIVNRVYHYAEAADVHAAIDKALPTEAPAAETDTTTEATTAETDTTTDVVTPPVNPSPTAQIIS